MTTHGHSRVGKITPEYRTWSRIITRCFNPNYDRYAHYGARGITVCDRWKYSFTNFLSDMGKRPSPKHSIDRIDGKGNYEPGNCRWATPEVQQQNRSSVPFFAFRGESHCLTDWSKILGIGMTTLWWRINNGWSVEDTFSLPRSLTRREYQPRR